MKHDNRSRFPKKSLGVKICIKVPKPSVSASGSDFIKPLGYSKKNGINIRYYYELNIQRFLQDYHEISRYRLPLDISLVDLRREPIPLI